MNKRLLWFWGVIACCVISEIVLFFLANQLFWTVSVTFWIASGATSACYCKFFEKSPPEYIPLYWHNILFNILFGVTSAMAILYHWANETPDGFSAEARHAVLSTLNKKSRPSDSLSTRRV